MKVFVCKFFKEDDIERRVSKLVSRGEKRAGNNLRIFCVDEQIQKRLKAAGIFSEVHYDFHRRYGYDDEESWERAYELSDELHLSAENDDSLKYAGINFLTLEYYIGKYIFIIKFSNLCRQMIKQSCKILILILTEPYNKLCPDINSPRIKTMIYGYNTLKFRIIAGRCYNAIRLVFSLLRSAFVLAKMYLEGLTRKDNPAYTQETEQKQKRALFVVSSQLYTRPAQAICDECMKNGLIPYVAPYSSDLAPLFQHHYIEYSNRIRSISLISFALRLGKVLTLLYRLRKHVGSFRKKGGHPDADSNEFSATYLCSKILLNELPQLCFQAIHHITFLERLIHTTSPQVICVMPDGEFLQQMASALAKKYKIPTLACSAAIDTGNAHSYMRHLHADKVAAMGEISKKIYLESGLEPARIVVTGIAHFDQLFNRNKELDSQELMSCGIDPNKEYIIFTTDNIDYEETETMLTGVISAIMKMEDVQLIVKVHPAEKIEKYQILADKYHDSRIHIIKDIDLYALISNCELLITKYSTTALEAMMIDKQVITINLSGEPTPVPYAEEGAALGVYQYEEIEPAILTALYDEETQTRFKEGRNNFVRRWAGKPDGRATQRIVLLMKEMIVAKDNTRDSVMKVSR